MTKQQEKTLREASKHLRKDEIILGGSSKYINPKRKLNTSPKKKATKSTGFLGWLFG